MTEARPEAPTPDPVDPEYAWKLLELVNSWIRQADTKAAAALTGAGLTGATLFNLAHSLTVLNPAIDVVAVLCAAAVVGAAALAGTALLPRLSAPNASRATPRLEQISPLYFRHISAHHGGSGEYRQVVRNLLQDTSALADEIAGQIWVNAAVATRKFVWANRAIAAFLVGLAALGVLAALLART